MSFTCAIVTPSDAVLDTPATYASFEAWDGQQGVATGASAFLTKLGTGVVTVQAEGGASRVFVLDGGFAQMDGKRLTLLTEKAMKVRASTPLPPSASWPTPTPRSLPAAKVP